MNRNSKKMWSKNMVLLMILAISTATASFAAEDKPLTSVQRAALADALKPSLVKVLITLRYDKGDEPECNGWMERCPDCGRFHGMSASELVSEERPLEIGGYLVADTIVILPDPIIHPRFIEKMEVGFGDALVSAKTHAIAQNQKAMFLELSEPLQAAQPLTFQPSAAGPYLLVHYAKANGAWMMVLDSVGEAVTRMEDGLQFRAVSSDGLIINKDGVPVGMTMNHELSVDEAWKGSPLDWPVFTAEQMTSLLAQIQTMSEQTLLHATLKLRSPKAQSPQQRYMDDDEEGSATEINTVAIRYGENQVLIPASLPFGVTARLETIIITTSAGETLAAKFIGSLSDYGGLVAELEKPLPLPLSMTTEAITAFRHQLLPAATILIQGDKRVAYYGYRRLAGFETGWRNHVYPSLPGSDSSLFLFDQQARLAALPIARRKKVQEDRWDRSESRLTAAADFAPVFADLLAHLDASNVPLSEAEENRMAWLGVELQPLDRELARIHKVSDLTQDGQTGAMVSYVYPDSPAAQAGIAPGVILLRLHVEGVPKPMDVELDDMGFYMENFPWDRLDEVPEEYFDRIPCPWPGVSNSFNQALTRIGLGKKFTAELVADGQRLTKDFVVTESPTHYDTAEKFKTAPLGLTVRNLTYEVRRYFQKLPDDPGVIVAKIEPGSKASVAGVKPYELITHINDQPVLNIADFERLIKDQTELRLSVKRMTQGRVVKILLDATPAAADPPTPEAP